MTKPTPGPWRVDRAGADPTRVYSDRGDERLVAECPAVDDTDAGESHANARLIAAAPALLAACRTAYARLNPGFGEHEHIAHGGEGTLRGILRAAIAEAEGSEG